MDTKPGYKTAEFCLSLPATLLDFMKAKGEVDAGREAGKGQRGQRDKGTRDKGVGTKGSAGQRGQEPFFHLGTAMSVVRVGRLRVKLRKRFLTPFSA